MGVDFLKRTKQTIIKNIDRGRVALATPDLLTRKPDERPRCYIASIEAMAQVSAGETLLVEKHGEGIDIRRGNAIVAKLDNPERELVSALATSGGFAKGIVQKVHQLSRKVEIAPC